MQNKFLKITGIAVIIIIVVVVLIFIYHFYITDKKNNLSIVKNIKQSQNQQQSSISDQKQASAQKTETKQPTSQTYDWKTFKDNYGFQMDYVADKDLMNAPSSKIVDCNNSCPTEITVNGIASSYANQTVNGTEYCVYSGAKASDKTFYNEYLFLVIKDKACYGLDVSYSYANCKNTANNTAEQNCKAKEAGDQDLIYKSLSTIKFGD